MLETVCFDGFAGVEQVVDIVEGVKVTDGGDAMLGEHLGVQVDDVARLGVEPDHVDAAAEGLQVGIGAGNFAEAIHHMERAFVAVEEGSLKARAAARFKMGLPCFDTGFDRGEEIFGEYTCSVDRLEAVAECGVHDVDRFLSHGGISLV